MRTLDALSEGWLQEVLIHLRTGGVLALPTETVYGLATRLDPEAVKRLFDLKGRAVGKALPLQMDSAERALDWGFEFSAPARRLAERFWPGPLTLLLNRPRRCPAWFAPDAPLVALRIPNHLVVRELLGFTGEPLAVTSANRTGKAECLDAGAVARAFQGADDLLVLDGGRAPGGVASTVVDASGAEPAVKREGPIAASEILRAWRGEA